MSPDPSVTSKRIYYSHSGGNSGYETIPANYGTWTGPGGLTAGSPPSSNTAISGVTGTVPLSNLPLPPAGHARRIYRQFNGAGSFLLTVELGSATDTTYVDTKSNGALGAAAPSTATLMANRVTVSAIPTGGASVTGRGVYRTAVGSPTLKRIELIANNTTTTTDDGNSDADIAGLPAAPVADLSATPTAIPDR